MKRFAPPPGAGAGAPGDPLDALLGRLPEPNPPPDLAARTLEAVRAEAALDRLLERHLPGAVPAGLADRVLAGLGPAPRARRPRLLRPFGLALALAAAALLALALTLWRRPPVDGPGERLAQAEPSAAAPSRATVQGGAAASSARTTEGSALPAEVGAPQVDPELLAVLDVLENWETLTDPSLLALELEQDSSWWSELEAALQGASPEGSDGG